MQPGPGGHFDPRMVRHRSGQQYTTFTTRHLQVAAWGQRFRTAGPTRGSPSSRHLIIRNAAPLPAATSLRDAALLRAATDTRSVEDVTHVLIRPTSRTAPREGRPSNHAPPPVDPPSVQGEPIRVAAPKPKANPGRAKPRPRRPFQEHQRASSGARRPLRQAPRPPRAHR